MNGMVKRMLVFAIFAWVVAIGWAEESEGLLGRDVVRDGERTTLRGILERDGDEWYLVNAAGRYELQVAPIMIDTAGNRLKVWTADRRPTWSGQGRGRNSVND